MELIEYLKQRNAETLAWVAADPENRGACTYVEDISFWNSMSIFTVAQFEHYNLATNYYELYKSVYGFKPNWGEVMKTSDDDLRAYYTSLIEYSHTLPNE